MPGQGVTSMFNFGQTFGAIKGVCAALGLPIFFVRPSKWKKHFDLINSQKDARRTKVIEMFPKISPILSRKKDIVELANKQDPILIKFGGGCKDIEVRVLESETGPMVITHLLVDCRDAMGANAVNTMAEAVAPKLEAITGGTVHLRIIWKSITVPLKCAKLN